MALDGVTAVNVWFLHRSRLARQPRGRLDSGCGRRPRRGAQRLRRGDGVPWFSTQSAHRDDAGSQWEGRDAKDNLQVGSLVPDAGAGAGIGFEGAYGKEWEGRDSLDNLQAGSLVPDKGASRREGYEGAYGTEWEGRDAKDNIATGSLLPDAGAGRREGFAAAYGEAHEGWDARESG